MKLPCELVQDLLPLYHDGVCSEVSQTLVTEHLKNCPDCHKILQAIEKEIEVPEAEQTDSNELRSIQKKWQASLAHACMRGLSIGAVLVILLVAIYLAVFEWNWLPISTYDCQIAEIYQLADGRILYRMDLPENAWSRSFRFEHHEDGSDYIIPVRSLIDLGQVQGLPDFLTDYHLIDPAENNAYQKDHGHGNPVIKWYWGHPNGAILIYEEGMVLEPAPDHLEELYG